MTMIPTPCPACHAPTMPAPVRRGRNVWVTCPTCGTPCRAKFYDIAGGDVRVEYHLRKDHRKSVVRRVSAEFAALMVTADFQKFVLDNYGIVL